MLELKVTERLPEEICSENLLKMNRRTHKLLTKYSRLEFANLFKIAKGKKSIACALQSILIS